MKEKDPLGILDKSDEKHSDPLGILNSGEKKNSSSQLQSPSVNGISNSTNGESEQSLPPINESINPPGVLDVKQPASTPPITVTPESNNLTTASTYETTKEVNAPGSSLSETALSLSSGVASAGAMLARSPKYLSDLANKTINTIVPLNLSNLPADAAKRPNAIASHLEDAAKQFDQESDVDHPLPVIDYFKNGEYGKAFSKLGNNIVKMLPVSAGIIAASSAGVPELGIAAGGTVPFGAAEKQNLIEKNEENKKAGLPTMSDEDINNVSLISGALEGATEALFGNVKLGSFYNDLATKSGKEVADKVVGDGVKQVLAKGLGKYFGTAVEEMAGEGANQYLDNLNHIYVGGDTETKPWDNVMESALVGLGSAGVMGAPILPRTAIQVARTKSQQTEAQKHADNQAVLKETLADPNSPPEVKEAATYALHDSFKQEDELTAKIQKEHQDLPENKKFDVGQHLVKEDVAHKAIQALMNRSDITEDQKEQQTKVFKDQIDFHQKAVEDIFKENEKIKLEREKEKEKHEEQGISPYNFKDFEDENKNHENEIDADIAKKEEKVNKEQESINLKNQEDAVEKRRIKKEKISNDLKKQNSVITNETNRTPDYKVENGDKISAVVAGKEINGVVTGVGKHKNQIVVDLRQDNGDDRFVYAHQITDMQKGAKPIDSLTKEQRDEKKELQNKIELSASDLKRLRELNKLEGIGLEKSKPIEARHSIDKETEEGIVSGNSNPSLTKEGKDKAVKLGDKIEEKGGIEKIIVSDTKRAEQTGEAIVEKTGAKLEVNPKLDPWDVGDFHGSTDEEFHKAEEYFSKNPDSKEFDGKKIGESLNEYANRVIPERAALEEKHDEKTIIVNHGANIRLWNAVKEAGGWNEKARELFVNNKVTEPGTINKPVHKDELIDEEEQEDEKKDISKEATDKLDLDVEAFKVIKPENISKKIAAVNSRIDKMWVDGKINKRTANAYKKVFREMHEAKIEAIKNGRLKVVEELKKTILGDYKGKMFSSFVPGTPQMIADLIDLTVKWVNKYTDAKFSTEESISNAIEKIKKHSLYQKLISAGSLNPKEFEKEVKSKFTNVEPIEYINKDNPDIYGEKRDRKSLKNIVQNDIYSEISKRLKEKGIDYNSINQKKANFYVDTIIEEHEKENNLIDFANRIISGDTDIPLGLNRLLSRKLTTRLNILAKEQNNDFLKQSTYDKAAELAMWRAEYTTGVAQELGVDNEQENILPSDAEGLRTFANKELEKLHDKILSKEEKSQIETVTKEINNLLDEDNFTEEQLALLDRLVSKKIDEIYSTINGQEHIEKVNKLSSLLMDLTDC